MEKGFAGLSNINIYDPSKNIELPGLVLYPASVQAENLKIGPFPVKATRDAPIKPGRYPLVILSHGSGGNYLAYLSLMQFLANHGFIVLSIEHYKNNRNNNELEDTIENFEYRPKHIRLGIDAMLQNNRFANSINREKIAVIGHSMGGYTALALAGGVPYLRGGTRVSTRPDPRVKAIVLMAPATDFFNYEGGLKHVKVPVLFFSAQKDPFTPFEKHRQIVNTQLAHNKNVIFKGIENAGHFSFLSPFPESMTNPGFLPATDPPGFDRAGFHKEMNKMVLDFLNKYL